MLEDNAIHVIRKEAKNILSPDRTLFVHEIEKYISPMKVLSYRRITYSLYCVALNMYCLPLRSSFPDEKSANLTLRVWWNNRGNILRTYRQIFSKKRMIPKGTICIDKFSAGYFHWMTDVLPRIYMVKDKLSEYPLLLPISYKERSYIIESLKLVGTDDEHIYWIENGMNIKIKETLIPTHQAVTGNYNPTLMQKIATWLSEDVECSQESRKNIFVSRQKAQTRLIKNFDEVEKVLKQYNFEIVYTEDMTLKQQIKLFSHAKCVIGVHGAGLTNMMFAQRGARILELRKQGNNKDNCYFSLSSVFDIDYYYQQCEAGIEDGKEYYNVDISRLKENIKLMGIS